METAESLKPLMEQVIRARLGRHDIEAARLSEKLLNAFGRLDKSNPDEVEKARKAFEAMITAAEKGMKPKKPRPKPIRRRV